MKGLASRKLAVEVLIKVEQDSAYANLALSSGLDKSNLSERDRAFVTAIVQGVLRHRNEVDSIIDQLSHKRLSKLPAPIRNTLRVGLYQLKFMTDIPSSAVLTTTTEIAKIVGHKGTASLVHGLMRAYLRNADSPTQAAAAADGNGHKTVEQLANQYSVAPWLVEKWQNDRGYDETIKLLEYSQSVPELTLRACLTAITSEGLAGILENNGYKVRPGRLVPDCLIVEDRGKNRGPVEKIPGYADGMFTVQDEAAAFVSSVMAAVPGEVVVDLCAAPGGKSVHMAEMMENKGRVIAVDNKESRLQLLKDTRRRLGLTNIETVVADGTSFRPETPVDKVLLDAPCTGTGVINRKTDLRYKRQPPDLQNLVALQKQLLEQAASMLKPGGVLVYSTCSIEPEENDGVINDFVATHPDFKLDSLVPYAGKEFLEAAAPDTVQQLESGRIQFNPAKHGVSGFYVARLVKDRPVSDESISSGESDSGSSSENPPSTEP